MKPDANYSELSHEGVVASEPEVVLVTQQDLDLFGGEDGLWRAYPTLRQTPAGQANRVWIMPDLQLKATSVASGAGAVAFPPPRAAPRPDPPPQWRAAAGSFADLAGHRHHRLVWRGAIESVPPGTVLHVIGSHLGRAIYR